MRFSLIDYILWLSAPILQGGLLVVLFRRGLPKKYPYFFAYIVLQIVSFGVLLVAPYSKTIYPYGYWVLNALSIFISVAIFWEIFRDVFRPYDALGNFSALLFGWSAAMFVLLGCMWALTSRPTESSTANILSELAGRSIRLMQCGVGFFVLLVGKYLGVSRRHIVYGIALGFGLFTSCSMLMSRPIFETASLYWRINVAACDLAVLIWLLYAARGTNAIKIRTVHLFSFLRSYRQPS